MTTKFPSSPVSSRAARLVAHRLGVLVLQSFHGGLPGEDVHHHQAVLRLPPRVLAEVDEVGLQLRRGRAAARVGTASAGPSR